MFDVFLNQLFQICDVLVGISDRHFNEISNIDSVIAGLSSLSGMGDAVSKLKQEKEKAEINQRGLTSLFQGLQKTCICYDTHEDQIIGNADGAQLIFNRREVILQRDFFDEQVIKKIPFIV